MVRKDDNRGDERALRRIMVRYGVDATDKAAFTKNLSVTGLYVQTNTVFKPGTTLQVELVFPDRSITMWGTVVWAKKVPPQLAHVLDCGMGVRFRNPPAEWAELFEAWRTRRR